MIGIGTGGMPAFVPAQDELAAPISALQNVFVQDYGLKKYAPIIMHLHHFNLDENRPVYYSLSQPTTAVFSPRSNKSTSNMSDLRHLKDIMDALIDEIACGHLGVEKTPFFKLAHTVNYDFHHTDEDIY